ncbi:MAG TPA: M20/M25/M40 family metallo-hydrolase [Xanthobacteraceae bacterium]|jgi:acetylornithine deacetylase/succinyl-diaminopimelate desuccinylase-like protein
MSIDVEKVFGRIDVDELVKVALDLANIDSPTGREGPVADYVQDWLRREGFDARKVGLYPDRPNVLATLPGAGSGRSLCFNSHMDTAVHQEEWWANRHAGDAIFHSAWREGDMLVGNGIVNDKGPMATWLLAAKAIKDSRVTLQGDLLLMAVVGEIGVEPVDEFQPPQYIAKEAGTRYAITHGGVADYALVAEGTDFGIVGVEAGKAFFKITVFGEDVPIYTPYIQRPTTIEKNPNAILRMCNFAQKVEHWAGEYENKNRYECAGGQMVPKVNIGAIRGGVPWKITKTVQQCAIYVDVRITPVQEPLDIREDLRRLLREAGMDGEVELYAYRPAFEADPKKVEPLKTAITRAHRGIMGSDPKPAPIPASSMWRDINCFNEMRIPSLTYGPGVSSGGGKYAMKIENMILGAKLYAQTAIDLCSQPRDGTPIA